MNTQFLFWAFILISSLSSIGLCTRILALNMVSISQSLVVRGIVCLVFVFFLAAKRHLSLKPKSLKIQFFRAGLAGLALTFFSLSYNWLSASSIAVLSNIDVPLLVLLGPLLGLPSTKKTRLLSFLSIGFLIWYLSGFEIRANLFYGLTTLMLGTLLLCFGYLYLKKSMSEENEAIAVLTPSLAIIFFGSAESVFNLNLASWNFYLLAIAIFSGIGMFGAYIATMRLYEITDLASAEFPTLIASIAIQPLELFFLKEPIQLVYLLSSVGFVLVTYFILNLQKNLSVEVSS